MFFYFARRFPERRAAWLSLDQLRDWKGPEPLVWGLIACGFVLLAPGLDIVNGLALNVLLVIAACYFAQGLAIIAFFFHKNKVPRFLRGITYVLIVLQQIFTLMVVGLGLFDLWGDFRRLKKNNLTPTRRHSLRQFRVSEFRVSGWPETRNARPETRNIFIPREVPWKSF